MGAPAWQQLLLVLSITFVLEALVVRPVRRLSSRARKLGIHDNQSSPFEALERAIVKLEQRFDKRLQESERQTEQIRSILSALPDSVLHFDAQDQLLFLNPAAELALEMHRHDLIGKSLAASWTNFLKPPQKSPIHEPLRISFEKPGQVLLQRVLESQTEGNDRFQIGNQRTYRSLVIPLGEEGDRILVLRDITDLKRLEEVRQLFLGSISHELRTPLTIIKGFAITLLDHPDVPADFAKPLKRIDSESDRLTRLVNDLIDLSQIQTRRLSLQVSLFNARELVEETLSLLAPLAERRAVELRWLPDAIPRHTLYGDRDRIKQVLINLIDNAIKFTPGGGRVIVQSYIQEHEWVLVVQDSGPGVSATDLPNLFEHFFRGKHSRKFAGSGLGLAIVKEIVELHQGKVEAFSPEQQSDQLSGLRVWVRLPRHQEVNS
jgi:two-component system phosphate regulon sensor histidine kinase PhoR